MWAEETSQEYMETFAVYSNAKQVKEIRKTILEEIDLALDKRDEETFILLTDFLRRMGQ